RRDVRAVRHLHAELPARPAPDLLLRRDAALAADLRLHRSARGAVERPALAHAAGDHAGARPRRSGHAHPALEPARGADRGLRADRPRQGVVEWRVVWGPVPRTARISVVTLLVLQLRA